ncbi:UNVERIFIED_CONTAM: capsular polysaccharide biosynthesis protein [Williamsia faeni]
MGVTQYFAIARRRWRIVVVCALLGIIAGAGYSLLQETTYTSSSQMYVSIQTTPGSNDAFQSVQAAQQRLVSYASLANGEAVTQAVIDQLDLDATPAEIGARITVGYPPGTVLLNITTTGASADEAHALNAAVDEQLQALIRRLESPPGGGNPAASLSVVDPPSEGTAVSSSTFLYAAAGLVAGLALGTLIAFVRDRSVRTVFTADAASRALRIPVIGPVNAGHPADAQMRMVRTDVLAANAVSGVKTVFVTGVGADSAPVGNALVSTLIKAGRRTILVDARFGRVAATGEGPGLGEVLIGAVNTIDCLSGSDTSDLRTMGSGLVDESSVNLIASPRFGKVLDTLEEIADFVVVQMGELDGSPEITSAAQHPVVAVLVVQLGGLDASEMDSVASGLIEVATAGIGVGVSDNVTAGEVAKSGSGGSLWTRITRRRRSTAGVHRSSVPNSDTGHPIGLATPAPDDVENQTDQGNGAASSTESVEPRELNR